MDGSAKLGLNKMVFRMLLNASNYDGVSGAGRSITAVNTSHSLIEQIYPIEDGIIVDLYA